MATIPLGGLEPHAHVKDMDTDTGAGGVLYPSQGLTVYRVPDSTLLSAIFRAYNDWLADFCQPYPQRLKGLAMLNVDDAREAVGELHRQFVLHAGSRAIHEEQRTLVERLLREKISLHGICRGVGVSIRWLMDFMVARFQASPDHLHVQPVASPCDVIMGRLEAEADEMWSFVKQKTNKQRVWIAMDQQTRHIIAFRVGDRCRESARQLWANLPEVYRTQATFYTDQYDAYTGVIPAERHQAITKDARKTNHLECFNNMLPQRLSRLVRETLAFSKKVEHHIGAIRYCICYYNLARAMALPV